METIISVKNLRKAYKLGRESVIALNNINLDIKQGEVCCILGTSGSGKSTLLNMLAGLEKPTKGAVFIGKHNISRFSEVRLARFRQKHIGFVFQSYNLLPALTALENVSMPLMFRGMDKTKRNREATFMLKQVGLATRLHHRPSQMSGGQQQRVGIARAFVAKPKIVFADEPTGNLDTKTTVEVMELLVRMSRENNQTFVLVTHDRELAQYADRIVTIIDGHIVSDEANISKIDRKTALENQLETADSQGMEIISEISDEIVMENPQIANESEETVITAKEIKSEQGKELGENSLNEKLVSENLSEEDLTGQAISNEISTPEEDIDKIQ